MFVATSAIQIVMEMEEVSEQDSLPSRRMLASMHLAKRHAWH